jgi:hypothetical protein
LLNLLAVRPDGEFVPLIEFEDEVRHRLSIEI